MSRLCIYNIRLVRTGIGTINPGIRIVIVRNCPLANFGNFRSFGPVRFCYSFYRQPDWRELQTTRPKDNSPQDNSPQIHKKTRPIFIKTICNIYLLIVNVGFNCLVFSLYTCQPGSIGFAESGWVRAFSCSLSVDRKSMPGFLRWSSVPHRQVKAS